MMMTGTNKLSTHRQRFLGGNENHGTLHADACGSVPTAADPQQPHSGHVDGQEGEVDDCSGHDDLQQR